MLQAREILCILLLVASTLPEGYLYAQNIDSSQAESHLERLTMKDLHLTLELDLSGRNRV